LRDDLLKVLEKFESTTFQGEFFSVPIIIIASCWQLQQQQY